MLPAPSLVRVRVPGASWAPRSVFRSTSSAALVQRLAAPGGAPSNSQGRHTHLRGNGRPAVSWLGAGKAAAAQGAAARLAQGEAHDSQQRHGRRLLQFVSRDEVEIVGDAADCGGHAQKFPGYRSKGNVDTFQHHARRGLSHHSATAPRPILKIRIQSSLLGSMSVAAGGLSGAFPTLIKPARLRGVARAEGASRDRKCRFRAREGPVRHQDFASTRSRKTAL